MTTPRLLFLRRRPLQWLAGPGIHPLVLGVAMLVAFVCFVGLGRQALAGTKVQSREVNVWQKPDGTPVTHNMSYLDTFKVMTSPPPEIGVSTWGQGWTRRP